jgi:hypothetical protein
MAESAQRDKMRNGGERWRDKEKKRWTAECGEGGDVDGWNSVGVKRR